MKILKEDLDNLERVENRQTVQGIMMKDAEEQSKKSEDNFKEVAGNPEDLKKKKPFISGEKQPKPKDVKLPKPELEESLFEEVDDKLIDLDTKDPQYLFMLLSRMKSDCDYVLGSGGKGAIKYLWAGSVDGQIETMKYIYNLLVPKYVNDIEYHKIDLNIAETNVTVNKSKEEKTELTFIFVTDIKITDRNIEQIFNAGRSRWKIENQGFNNQKNIRYNITHMCCLDNTAMKNHYLLVQISDIIRQLLEHGSVAIRELKLGIKEISSRILESFRRDPLTSEDISNLKQHIKIRDL